MNDRLFLIIALLAAMLTGAVGGVKMFAQCFDQNLPGRPRQ